MTNLLKKIKYKWSEDQCDGCFFVENGICENYDSYHFGKRALFGCKKLERFKIMDKTNLRKEYPLVTKKMLTWFIPVLLVFLIFILMGTMEIESPKTAIVFTVVVGLLLCGVSATGFVYQLCFRNKRLNGTVNTGYGIAYVLDKNASLMKNRKFINDICKIDVIGDVFKYMKNLGYNDIKRPKLVFCWFSPKVFARTFGVEHQVKGKQNGYDITIGEDFQIDTKLSLLAHELVHVILSFSKQHKSKQHEQMSERIKTKVISDKWYTILMELI